MTPLVSPWAEIAAFAAPYRLRRAQPDDVPTIMRIERGEGYDRLVGRSDASRHQERFSDSGTAIWMLEDGDRPLAFAILEGLGDPHGGIYLRRISAVEPGKGHGGGLLRATLAWSFLECAAPRYWLDVFAHNTRARQAYARAGLVEEGTMRSAYALDDGTRADRVFMSILAPEWRLRYGFAGT